VIRIILALGLLVGGAGSSLAASNCNVPYFKLIADVEVTGYMYVRAGKAAAFSRQIRKAAIPGFQ